MDRLIRSYKLWIARHIGVIVRSVPYTVVIFAVLVGVAMGFSFAKIQNVGQMRDAQAAQLKEIQRIDTFYREFFERLGIKVDSAASKAQEAASAAQEAAKTADSAAQKVDQAIPERKK